MKISGFSFVRNAQKLYYPVVESIKSILPVCNEFVIAIGKGDADDHTLEMVRAIGDPKIRIIETVWDENFFTGGQILSQQTNIALAQCTGDWCFYIQADEVLHEKYLQTVYDRCEQLMDDTQIDGLLFNYKHFWGDYDHYNLSHAWYPKDIRVIRNNRGIESWKDAQSFRKNRIKINVASVDACIFHYGFVRPPRLMRVKSNVLDTFWGKNKLEPGVFNYGSLRHCAVYKDGYPEVMKEKVKELSWKDQLQYTGKSEFIHKHDRFKYRFLTLLEQKLLGGRQIGGFKNYVLIKR
jgi:glycosyltransferase involved in cell wall biosynthesis